MENAARAKPIRTATQLQAMVQVRINAQPAVQARIAGDVLGRGLPVAGKVHRHPVDQAGRTWNLTELTNGAGLEHAFRAIVDGLRDSYDLAEPS